MFYSFKQEMKYKKNDKLTTVLDIITFCEEYLAIEIIAEVIEL